MSPRSCIQVCHQTPYCINDCMCLILISCPVKILRVRTLRENEFGRDKCFDMIHIVNTSITFGAKYYNNCEKVRNYDELKPQCKYNLSSSTLSIIYWLLSFSINVFLCKNLLHFEINFRQSAQ